MRILILSIDEKVCEEGSRARERMVFYGSGARRLDIIVYTKKGREMQQISKNVYVHPTNTGFRLWYFIDAYVLARKVLRGERGDEKILITAQEGITAFLGLYIARKYGALLEVQAHGDIVNPSVRYQSPSQYLRFLAYRFVLPRADGIRVVSERIKRSLLASGIVSESAKIYSLPIFVDGEKFEKAKVSFDLHERYPQFDTIVLMMSRLEPEKDITTALHAFREVVKTHPKTGLVIVGSGSEDQILKLKAKSYKLEANIVFSGWTDDPVSYYKGADIFLSTSKNEGYGMTFVEAAASGCPIVSTDVGIMGDIFVTEKSALVCRVGDRECLAQNLLRLIEHKALRESLREEAYKAVQRECIGTEDDHRMLYMKSWEQIFD